MGFAGHCNGGIFDCKCFDQSAGSSHVERLERQTVMKSKDALISEAATHPAGDSSARLCDTQTIESLQAVVSALLMKNQTMRFEIDQFRQKLMAIEDLFFGFESYRLQHLIPPDVLFDLRNLCQTAEPGTRRWDPRLYAGGDLMAQMDVQ
jgi:hypothetical protein